MKKYSQLLALILCTLFIVIALLPQHAVSQTKFKKYSGNPVLTVGPAGSWDETAVMTGSVIYHNSKYHLWYNGYKSPFNSIGYAFSDDGITWTKFAGNPVLIPGNAATFDANLGGCFVLFYSGKFHMWYDGINGDVYKIGYAYSDDGILWTKHPTPVFEKGSGGDWDVGLGGVGPVIKEDTLLKMFYWGKSSTGSYMTCLATSPDSIHWTRYNSGNPVLAGGVPGAWDQYSQGAGAVLKNSGLYEMWYCNWTPSPYCIGYASSTNGGLNWTTYSGNPVLQAEAGKWDGSWTIWPTAVQRPDGRYLLYYSGGVNGAKIVQQIGLAIDTAITQLSGTYTVGKSGNFPSLDSAFARLSRDGILGPVTFLLTDTLYDATSNANGSYKLVGPIAGAGPSSRITIRPADNVAVTIKGNGDATLWFNHVSYLTLDGVSLQGNTQLKVHAFYNASFKYNDAIDFWGNSDNNIIQNLTARSDDITRYAVAVGLFGYDNLSGSSDSCLISGLSITSGPYGIYLYGPIGLRPTGNVIRNNHIGSPSDSLIAWGIHNEQSDGTIIENNHIENLRLNVPSLANEKIQLGINSWGTRNTIVRNNVVHNLRMKDLYLWMTGINASGGTSGHGSNGWIYNNKVWDINNGVAQSNYLSGIRAVYQDSLKVEYNSIFLSESGDTPPTDGSNAVWFQSTCVYPTVRNNILVNTRNDSPYVSVAVRMDAPTSLSDHNDLYVGSSSCANIATINTMLYKTLADWQTTGKDLHSLSMSPLFLTHPIHIDTTNATMNSLEGKGTPIAGILTDFEGQLRSKTTPDFGADEFDKVTGVTEEITGLPETFSLSQNYPNPFNPSTTIRYALPSSANVKLSVHDLLGREIVTLVNEEQSAGWKEVEWNVSNVSSGIYFYKLQTGQFQETKRMILMK